jgi:hypothetical protein
MGAITKAEAAMLLVYNRALSPSERSLVEGYVASKWQYR